MAKNSADATLRNIRASHHRDAVLRNRITDLTQRVSDLERLVADLMSGRFGAQPRHGQHVTKGS